MSNPFTNVFQQKYDEFAIDLKSTLPELTTQIDASVALDKSERLRQFTETILPSCGPARDVNTNPGFVLPGVRIPDSLWSDLGDKSQEAIQEYLRILSFCCLYETSKKDGVPPNMGEWTETFLDSWKEKLSGMDFENLSKKLSEIKTLEGSNVILIPMAGNLNLTSIEILKETYNISQLPVILVNEKIKIETMSELAKIQDYIK